MMLGYFKDNPRRIWTYHSPKFDFWLYQSSA